MPFLPLPVGGCSLAGGALPVTGADDVLREFPEAHREPEVAPVRDAFAEGFAAGALAYQTESARAAAQADPTRATGIYLDLHGEDRDIRRHSGESDDSYRARLFAIPAVVSPEALLDGINKILSTVTTKKTQLIEPELDGWFVHACTGTEVWDSFAGARPTYLDRLYVANASDNGGVSVDGGDPGGCIPVSGVLQGRYFHLRVPALEGVDGVTLAAVTGNEGGVFLFDGTETFPGVTQYLFTDAVSADQIYSEIVDFVQRFKGQGIVWSLFVDPSL